MDKSSRAGYALVFVAFWGLVLYFFVTVVGSLLRSNYGGTPSLGPNPSSYGYKWCVERIANSEALLENRLMHTLQGGPSADAQADWPRWRLQWDKEVERNASVCAAAQSPTLAEGFAQLRSLAGQYDAVAQSMGAAGAAQRGLHAHIRQLNQEE